MLPCQLLLGLPAPRRQERRAVREEAVLFGKKQQQHDKNKPELLELDLPPTAVPSFDYNFTATEN